MPNLVPGTTIIDPLGDEVEVLPLEIAREYVLRLWLYRRLVWMTRQAGRTTAEQFAADMAVIRWNTRTTIAHIRALERAGCGVPAA